MQELTGRASLVLSSAFDARQTSRAYMDGEPLVRGASSHPKLITPSSAALLSLHPQTIVMSTTISLREQVALRTFDVPIRLHIGKLG